MKQKMELIRQIRAMEAVSVNRNKLVDLAAPAGYGFLSENAAFVQVVEDHQIAFIGPKAEHIRIMGDKITAKDTMKNLGVPCVPGSDGGVDTRNSNTDAKMSIVLCDTVNFCLAWTKNIHRCDSSYIG